MKLSEMVVSILIFSGVMVGMSFSINQLGTFYGLGTYENSTAFNQFSEVESDMEALQTRLGQGTKSDVEQLFDILNVMFFDVVPKMLTNIPNMFDDIRTGIEFGISKESGIDSSSLSWIFTLAGLIAITVVVFKVFSIIAKRDI